MDVDQDILLPPDCDEDDLPESDLRGKEVREWLRDNLPGTELPCGFNTLVSLATHETARPYINLTGTWPAIIRNWTTWAWENGYTNACQQLLRCALFNTNATADQNGWMDIRARIPVAGKNAMDATFRAILPDAMQRHNKRAGLFDKNIGCILDAAGTWCTEECIKLISDEQVCDMILEPCKPINLFRKIFCLWLQDEKTRSGRVAAWSQTYAACSNSEKQRAIVENIGECAPMLPPETRSVLYALVTPENEHRFILLSSVAKSFRENKAKKDSLTDMVQLLTLVSEQPCDVADPEKYQKCFSYLMRTEIWEDLPLHAKRRLATYVACTYATESDMWASWYDSIANSVDLEKSLYTLINILDMKSWTALVQYTEVHSKSAELPEVDYMSSGQ